MEPFTESPERNHFAHDAPRYEMPRRMSTDPTLLQRSPDHPFEHRHLTYPPTHPQNMYPPQASTKYFPFSYGQPESYSTAQQHASPHALCPPGFPLPFMPYAYYPTAADLKPFRCSDCGQRFGRSHDLKRHHKIHLNLRPYCCFKCDRHFTRLDALRRHQTTKKCRQRDHPSPGEAGP